MTKLYILLAILILALSNTGFSQAIEIGMPAPEIIQLNHEGKEIKLSDLKGKMVLIDFWASWCAPCRKESPALVAAYNKYKDLKFKNGNGFVIFSVSLDMKHDRWIAAIAADQLDWPYHVCDLKHWRSKTAQDYNVLSIPANFLIDGMGVIVDVNLRGGRLESALKRNKARKLWK